MDTAAPTAEVAFDNKSKTVSAANFPDASAGTGVYYWQVLVNGQGKYPKTTKESTTKVTVSLKDNFDELRLTVNGDERFNHALSEPYAMNGFEQQIELELELANGTNEFVIEAEDLAGNITTQTIQIKKTRSSNEKPGKGNESEDEPESGDESPGKGNGKGK